MVGAGPRRPFAVNSHMGWLTCVANRSSLTSSSEFLSAPSSVFADRGVQVSVLFLCSVPIRSSSRVGLHLPSLAPPVFPFHVLALAHPPPMARAIGSSMDHDCRFDSPRSPVFVEGGWASPASEAGGDAILPAILFDLRSSTEDGRPQPVTLEGTRFFLRFSSISGLRRRRMGVPSLHEMPHRHRPGSIHMLRPHDPLSSSLF